MKSFSIGLILTIFISYAYTQDSIESVTYSKPIDLLNYNAKLWYQYSAEKKAIYHQVFIEGVSKVKADIDSSKLKPQTWAVVFGLDGTLVDNSAFASNNDWRYLRYQSIESVNSEIYYSQALSTPGAATASCQIQKLGGRVIIVTNRSVGGYPEIIKQTESELTRLAICHDSIIFARNSYDQNKNPRFEAITSGDYENIIATRKFAPLKVIAYFGSDIADFPNLNQNSFIQLPDDSHVFDNFGESYFMLPNPTRGDFKQNSLH